MLVGLILEDRRLHDVERVEGMAAGIERRVRMRALEAEADALQGRRVQPEALASGFKRRHTLPPGRTCVLYSTMAPPYGLRSWRTVLPLSVVDNSSPRWPSATYPW